MTMCRNQVLMIQSRRFQVDELRAKLEDKNKMIEKKTNLALEATQERNRIAHELGELRDQVDQKDRKMNVLQRKASLKAERR
jgi:hypothetical protein